MSLQAQLAELRTLFTSNSETAARITALQTENAAHVANLATLNAKLTEVSAQLEAAKAELATSKAEKETQAAAILTITAERDGAVAAKATAETALESLKANPSAQAQQVLAGMGVKPDQRPKADAKVAEQKTRAEFNALTPAARMAFVKAGGTLLN